VLESIPFKIPAEYAAAHASQELVRFGALLKDSGTGQIVAHLQETGAAHKLLDTAVKAPFSPLEAISAPASIAANAQLLELKSMVQGLQTLQFANLGATVVGIGISAIGFAVMSRKLSSISAEIGGLESQVALGFLEMRDSQLRQHLSAVRGLYERAKQAFARPYAGKEWDSIACAMADESAYFRGEIEYVLAKDEVDFDLFASLVHSLALCNSGRIKCLMLAGELKAAQRVAIDVGDCYNDLFDKLTPIELARARAASGEASFPEELSLKSELKSAKELVDGLRDLQDVSLSQPYLLDSLIAKGIDGASYIKALEEEKQHAVLVLEAGS
jgi:hypothetical protein